MQSHRPQCSVVGCEKPARNKGHTDSGKQLWGTKCDQHHRGSRNVTDLRRFDNTKCERCGWEGPCDRHRRDKNLGYVNGNVEILCPNCHRLESAAA